MHVKRGASHSLEGGNWWLRGRDRGSDLPYNGARQTDDLQAGPRRAPTAAKGRPTAARRHLTATRVRPTAARGSWPVLCHP